MACRVGGSVAFPADPLEALAAFLVLRPLEVAKLRRMAASVPRSKAPGVDALVERLERWPADRLAHLVALLPKGGTSEPMDRRPLWAAARGCVLRDWLRDAGVLRGGVASVADTLAGLLGLDLDLAQADDAPRDPSFRRCLRSRAIAG